ncbi:M48 family metallopeptidase [candidate division KSB1 bacterium]
MVFKSPFSIKKFILPVLVFSISVYFGCGANIFSTDQEVNMGSEFSDEIEKQVKIYDDESWQNYINEISGKIVSVCDRQDIKYTFKIVDDSSTVNAFALPGGFIYLYTGLLLKADNEAEIAGVIAHEVGHVVGKHGMKRLTSIYGYQILFSLALGSNPGQIQKMVADVIVGAGMLKYGRDNEFEADGFGIKYAYAAGYDPKAFVTFFEKLGQIHTEEPSSLERLLSTHPLPDDRITNAKTLIENLPGKGLVYNTEKFRTMKSRLYKK